MIGAVVGLVTFLFFLYIKYRFHIQFILLINKAAKWVRTHSDEPKSREDTP